MEKVLSGCRIKSENTNAVRQRNSNIEWLRIISMLLIVAYHMTRSECTSPEQPFGIYFSGNLIGSWGILGVDLFLIISAWFLSEQAFQMKRVIHVVFQTFTWAFAYILYYFLYNLLHYHAGLKQTLDVFFIGILSDILQPLWCGCYWFVTAYVFLLLLFPFLNKLFDRLQKQQIRKLLIVFSFVPVYVQFSTSPVNDVFLFLYVYMLIGYIKRYGSSIVEKYAKPVYCVLILAAVVCAKVLMYFLSDDNVFSLALEIILPVTLGATIRHSIILLLAAILIFFTVLKRKPTYSKTVNTVASYTLGVYLFHENHVMGLPNTLDRIVEILSGRGLMAFDILFPIRYIGTVVAVSALGIILESFRNRLLQKPFMNWVSVKWKKQIDAADNWFNQI